MARKKHEAEKKHALRKKEAPPVQDMPDETEHPALSEKKKPRVSKLLYRIIAALLIAVVLLIILENKDNLTPENIGNWIRTKAVGFGFGDAHKRREDAAREHGNGRAEGGHFRERGLKRLFVGLEAHRGEKLGNSRGTRHYLRSLSFAVIYLCSFSSCTSSALKMSSV